MSKFLKNLQQLFISSSSETSRY